MFTIFELSGVPFARLPARGAVTQSGGDRPVRFETDLSGVRHAVEGAALTPLLLTVDCGDMSMDPADVARLDALVALGERFTLREDFSSPAAVTWTGCRIYRLPSRTWLDADSVTAVRFEVHPGAPL